MKALGVSPDYVAAMRAAAPQLARLEPSEFSGMKAVGVTPDFARGWASSGFRNVNSEQLTEARAVGLTGEYVRSMIAAGIRGSFDDYVQLRVMGVSPGYVERLRRSGVDISDPDKLVEMQALGIGPKDLALAGVGPRAAARTGSGELQLSVAAGVTVKSKDGSFSCTGVARCRFQVSGTVILVAVGRDDVHWSGCHQLLSANSCEMRIRSGTVRVRVA